MRFGEVNPGLTRRVLTSEIEVLVEESVSQDDPRHRDHSKTVNASQSRRPGLGVQDLQHIAVHREAFSHLLKHVCS